MPSVLLGTSLGPVVQTLMHLLPSLCSLSDAADFVKVKECLCISYEGFYPEITQKPTGPMSVSWRTQL